MSKFSERVRALRLNMNLSLRQLSKLTDISPSAIHSYEVGKREASHQSLEALSDVFNCDIDYLLGKTDIKNSAAYSLGYESLYEAYKAGALGDFPLSDPPISKNRQKLIDWAKSVPEDKVEPVLQALETILAILK